MSNYSQFRTKKWFSCPIENCPRKFQSIGGHTQHTQAKHDNDRFSLQDMLATPGNFSRSEPSDNGNRDFPPDDSDFEMGQMALNDNTSGFDIRTSQPESSESSHSRSPSQVSESVPNQSTFTECHPVINGESIKLHGIHFFDSPTNTCR